MSEAVAAGNLNNDNPIIVMASCTTRQPVNDQSPPMSSSSSRFFFVDSVVYIEYRSSDRSDRRRIPDGCKSEKSFEFTTESITTGDGDRSSASWGNITGMISDMKIPFTMENIHWISRKSETVLPDPEDLTNRVLDLARSIIRDEEQIDNGGVVLGMNLRVVKKMTLPAEEFEAMYDSRIRKRRRSEEDDGDDDGWEMLLRENRKDVHFCRDLTMVLCRLNELGEGKSKVMGGLLKIWKVDGRVLEEECSICKVEMGAIGSRVLIRMHCSHVYHPRCIFKWLLRSDACPLCRYDLVANLHNHPR